ncbi:MAG: DUF3307 domain-containing protein [Paracoccaceae bacterium]
MSVTIGTVLLLLVALQIKHMFADYFMQTPKMLAGRGEYFHFGRAQHAAVHAAGSILVFLVFGAPVVFTIIIAAIEWVIHFNIDYCKARYSDCHKLNPGQAAFWRAAGVDQAAHHLTYIAMAWAWTTTAV